MNQPLKILLLEDDPITREQVENYIENKEDVILTHSTANSQEAVLFVEQDRPDAVIIDLELHYGSGNGLEFLGAVDELALDYHPYLLVTTNNSSQTTHEAARALGADFILAKYEDTYSAKYVIDFLLMMRQLIHKRSSSPSQLQIRQSELVPPSPASDRTIREEVNKALNSVGISPKAVGYQYLSDCIILKAKDMTTNVYAEICPIYHKSDASVERAMQNAINRAWRTSDPEELLQAYTARVNSDRGVPTVMEFIYYYATVMRTKLYIE